MASVIAIDDAGRIVVPQALRQLLGTGGYPAHLNSQDFTRLASKTSLTAIILPPDPPRISLP